MIRKFGNWYINFDRVDTIFDEGNGRVQVWIAGSDTAIGFSGNVAKEILRTLKGLTKHD